MGKHRKWFWISGLYDNKRDLFIKRYIKWDPLYYYLVGSAHTAVEQLVSCDQFPQG